MSGTDDDRQEEMYSLEEAADIIEKAVERKRREIESLRKKGARLRAEEKKSANQSLIDYLEADINAYLTVIADMRDDDSYLEGVDLDADPVEIPPHYSDYLDGLSADDLENELDAESLRADYCDDVVEEMCVQIGESALRSKKMIKAMLDDPFALEQIGEVIFYDDYLYDLFKSLSESKEGSKSKKKKKKKRSTVI